MPSFTTTSLQYGEEPLARVVVERRIFVGDDREAFLEEWLERLDADYPNGRIEGYVLDLTGGRLWAALDLSDASDEAQRDIALRAVGSDDARAREVFISLTRNCDPVTAVNILTCAFDRDEWPKLAATCDAFTRPYTSTPSKKVHPELTAKRYESSSISWQVIPRNIPRPMMPRSAEQHQHVYRCEFANLPEQITEVRGGAPTHVTSEILEVRLNDATAELVRRVAGSQLPERLDRENTNFLLNCIDVALLYRRNPRAAKGIQNLRRQLFPVSKLAITRG